MSELIKPAAAAVQADNAQYSALITGLQAAEKLFLAVSERTRRNYRYVEGCAKSMGQLADQMAALEVDRDTVADFRDAATQMRAVSGNAQTMANSIADLSSGFGQTAATHQAEYGGVADTAATMPVPMAKPSFYGRR